jgi:hypothetical protein
MPPIRRKGKMKEDGPTSLSGTQSADPGAPPKETIVTAPIIDSATTSPSFLNPGKTPPRKVLRLKCAKCDEYPEGFRSEHELRRCVRKNKCASKSANHVSKTYESRA